MDNDLSPPAAEPAAPSPPATTAPAPAAAKTARFPARHSAAFKKEMLARLPKMAEPRWDASSALNVMQDMKDISALDVDAFLQPLEALEARQRER